MQPCINQKGMMQLLTEKEFLFTWQHTDFTTYNETDIREDFIKDLLYILGYSKNTINDIIREKALDISEPFQRIGRQRVQIDYVPTIRLKSFWILEAKPGNIQDMNIGDMLQAYLYATHPEIQVPYIVLCNGWSLLIFDVQERKNWQMPFFSISNANCYERFEELKSILSAQNMLSFQRKKILKQIRDTFEVEIDINQFQIFKSNFNKMGYDLEKRIKENEKELWRTAFKKADEEELRRIKDADNKTLIIWMDIIGYCSGRYYLEYVKRLEVANPQERCNMLRLLMQTYLGRCHSIFKINCMLIFLNVVKKKLVVESSPFMNSPEKTLIEIVKHNITYMEKSEMQNALIHMENLCCKLSAIVIKNELMDVLNKKVRELEKNMPIEEKIIRKPTVAREMVPLINLYAEMLWRLYSYKNSVSEMYNYIWGLQCLIEEMKKQGEIKAYPDDDSDMLWYEAYGDSFDLLYTVSVRTLNSDFGLFEELGLESNILELGKMQREEAIKYIPKAKKRPNDYKMSDKLVREIIIALINSIQIIKQNKDDIVK